MSYLKVRGQSAPTKTAFTLEELGLVDANPPEAFDGLTRLATRILHAPVALISVVQEERDRQFFASQQGLPEPWATKRQTPLSHSFCQHVKKEGKPLVVNDARNHPLVRHNLAIRDLNVIAYLGVPILGPDGLPLGALCVIEGQPRKWVNDDIAALTDLARCVSDEILLRASLMTNEAKQERLALTIQASGDGIWDWNIETGELFWSERFMEMVGVDPEGFSPHINSFFDRLIPDDKERVRQALEQHLGHQGKFDVRYRLKHSNGRLIDISAKGQAAWNEDGKPVRMVGTVSDISELVESNDLLLRTERLANIGHWRIDLPDQRLRWSPETYRIQGFEPFEFSPTIEEAITCYHPEDRGIVEIAVSTAIQSASPYEFDARIVRPSGEIRHVHCAGAVSTNSDGETIGVFGSIQDRTKQVEQERQLTQAQKMEAFGQLAGGVAHDFNNLLAVIMGNIELLEEVDDPSVRTELSKAALNAVIRGRDLTGSLLNFARNAPLRPRRVKLSEMFAGLQTIMQITLPANQELTVDIPENTWPIEADTSTLESCILNLALNARDAMQNSGQLRISAHHLRRDCQTDTKYGSLPTGAYVVLEVADSGCGIPAKNLDRVFEPFFTTKPVGKGSGLGLSRVRGFAEQSGGAVILESSVGAGTKVQIILPASTVDASFDKEPLEKASPPILPAARILLAEDMDDVRNIMARRLTADGYEVVCADSGDSAIDLYKAGSEFDLLITDIVMPGQLQGTDLASKIQSMQPGIGVIYMSGHPLDALGDIATAPAHVYLSKPISKSELYTALDQVLNSRVREMKLSNCTY